MILMSPILYIIAFLITIIACIFSIILMVREKKRNKKLLDYQQTLGNLYDSTRMFRHNYKNTIIALNGYYKESDYKRIGEVIEELNKEYNEIYSAQYSESVAKIDDSGLKWLIISKISYAQSKGINFSVMVSDNFDRGKLTQSELYIIIGVLLDNAIEAAEHACNKRVKVVLYNDNKDTIFSVSNTYETEPEISKIFNKDYSTKKSHGGIGLYNVKRILDKYDNIYIDTRLEESLFVMDINIINSE